MDRPEMSSAILAAEFGFSYTELMEQPQWFIDDLWHYLRARSESQKNK